MLHFECMANKQQLLLQRLQNFKARQKECVVSRFYTAPYDLIPDGENFLAAEQIHVHNASGQCKTEYADIVEFWLHSLFNFLEDRFEDSELEKYAAQSEWKPTGQKEVSETARALFDKIQSSSNFETGAESEKAFQMFNDVEIVAFVVETKEEYASFFWRATTT